MELYYTPISTYCQKVMLAFDEKELEFKPQLVNLMDEEARAEYYKLYPIGKVPLLKLEDGYLVPESTIIIEYLEGHYSSGTKLIPSGTDEARRTRFMDRMNDLYLNNPISTLVLNELGFRNDSEDDLAQAKRYLDISYQHLNAHLAERTWLCGDYFTMADCSAIPPLFYAQKNYPFNDYPNLVAYFDRAMQRPTYQKVLDQALPALGEMQGH